MTSNNAQNQPSQIPQVELSLLEYLIQVYPLAKSDLATLSPQQLRAYFDQLHYYYKFMPQPEATIPTGKYIPRNTAHMPNPGDLYSPSVINPDGFWCRNIYPPTQPLKNPLVNGFSSNSLVEICHSNVYNGSLGIYYYYAKGSGVFVDVGKTLIVRNKLHCLRQLGLDNQAIANALLTDGTAYWPAVYDGKLPQSNQKAFFRTLVDEYRAKYTNATVRQAQDAIINAAINESNYHYGRLNDTGWEVDRLNFELATKKGYDTVQFTTQANMNNGWAFEIMDLRAQNHSDLGQKMNALRNYYTLCNPFNVEQQYPVANQWPYYNLYAEGTLSSIAKNYTGFDGRFAFPGMRDFPIVAAPASPPNMDTKMHDI